MDPETSNTHNVITELREEIKALKRDLYGNPVAHQRGLFERIDDLEETLRKLEYAYEAERTEKGTLAKMEDDLSQLKLDYRIVVLYIKGVIGGVATLVTAILIASIVGLLKYLSGGF